MRLLNLLLRWSVSQGKMKTSKLLIYLGADVNEKDYNAETVLHLAIKKDNTNIAKYLISQGADIHAQDKYGNTALDLAEKKNNKQTIEYFNELKNIDLIKYLDDSFAYKNAVYWKFAIKIPVKANLDNIRKLVKALTFDQSSKETIKSAIKIESLYRKKVLEHSFEEIIEFIENQSSDLSKICDFINPLVEGNSNKLYNMLAVLNRSKNEKEILEFMKSNKFDPNYKPDESCEDLLYLAIWSKSQAIVDELLLTGEITSDTIDKSSVQNVLKFIGQSELGNIRDLLDTNHLI